MRKLAIVTSAYSLSVLASAYFWHGRTALLVASSLAVLLLVLYLLRSKIQRNLLIAVFLSFCLGLFSYYFHYSQTVLKAQEVHNKTLKYDAEVIDYPTGNGNYSRVLVRILNSEAKGLKAYMYDYDHDISVLTPGMTISFTGKFKYVKEDEKIENYDTYLTSNILLKGNCLSNLICKRPETFPIRYCPVYLRNEIETICCNVFQEDIAPFFVSLLTGNKTRLYEMDAVYNLMSRAGIVHIVAVSGMHVVFLVGLVQTLFGKSRKLSLICVIFVWAFVLTTGNSPSAMRAAIMQTILLLAPLFYRENDSVTALSLALFLILIANPFAIRSISLQLSFGATLGICLFSGPINEALIGMTENLPGRKLLRYLAGTLANTIGVTAITLPICIAQFGFISLISPLTNILTLWLVPVCFAGGFLCCLIFLTFPGIGIVAGRIIALPARYILCVCKKMSSLPCSSLYISNIYGIVLLILIYSVVLITLFSKGSTTFKLVLSTLTPAVLLGMYLLFCYESYSHYDTAVSFIDVGQGECIAVTSGKRTVMIDCGSTYSGKAGENAYDYLKSNGVNHIDAIALTHLHDDHANGIVSLLESIDVSSIILPDYRQLEDTLFSDIINAAGKNHVQVYLINQDCNMSIGNISLSFYPAALSDEGNDDYNEACMTVLISSGECSLIVTGDSPSEREMELTKRLDLSSVTVAAIGHHGSKSSTCDEFIDSMDLAYSVISVGKNNSYGHPSAAVLNRLEEKGCRLFRTDLNGTVELFYKD